MTLETNTYEKYNKLGNIKNKKTKNKKTKKTKGVIVLNNKIIAGVVCAMALNVMTIWAYAQEREAMKAEYNLENRTLTVSAELQEGKKKFLNITILPNGVEFSEETIKNNEDVILRTVQTDITGKIEPKIIMPEKMSGKRFVCYMNTDNKEVKYRFSTAEATEVARIVSLINDSEQSEIKTIINSDIVQSGLGIADEEKSEAIAQYIYSQKPQEGYDKDSFLKTYMVAEGVAYMGEGEISLAEFVEEYAGYLGEDYLGEYNSLTETEQQALENMFANSKVTDGFAKAFDDNLFLAKYKTAESSVELGNLVTAYFTQNDISMSKFNQITNELYKDDIFAQMYANRTAAISIEKIIEDFDGLVKIALGKGTQSLNGGADGSQKPSMTVEGDSVNVSKAMFNDISSHWAKTHIESACRKGIVNGFENGDFLPDKNVTRAEFAKMMAQALKLETTQGTESIFGDVVADAWYNGCVSANANAGIILGDDKNNFNPQTDITRQDVAVMISRALLYKGVSLIDNNFGFADEAEFSAYASKAINTLATAGIINGYDDKTFLPNKTASRAEAVVMIMRMEELISE